MVLLYLASTLYHALPAGRAKRVLRASSTTARSTCSSPAATRRSRSACWAGAWGWTLFGLVWALAALGVTLKAFDRLSHPWLSTGLYLLMGWLVLIAAVPLWRAHAGGRLALLVAGGLAYTAGVAFFAMDSRLRYGHFIWHLFVVAGSAFHFFAVLWYAQ